MALVYDESVRRDFRGGKPVSEWSREAVMGAWETHLRNRAYLRFMASNGTYQEKAQAERELVVAARKLAFWERHPEFDKTQAKRVQDAVRAEWGSQAPARAPAKRR